MAENEEYYIGRGILTCDDDGKVHATEVLAVRKTHDGRDDMVRVTLDNGEHVDVTGDHKMMLRDGTFIEAKKLEPDDSLMPCYTRVAEEGTYKGYRLVKQNTTPGGWHPVYRMAARDGLFEGEDIPDGVMIHHVDEDKLNDDPSNLEAMTKPEHYTRHKEMIDRVCMVPGRRVASSDEVKKKRAEALRRPEVRAKISAAGKGRKQTAEHSRKISEANKGKKKPWMVGDKNVMADPKVRARHKASLVERDRKRRVRVLVEKPCERCGKPIGKCYIPSKAKLIRFCGTECASKRNYPVEVVNHKVVKVERLPGTHPTYDLLVASGAHTLPLAAGVFVHNSLPGSLGESALLRLDIRYARTVKRIQRAVVQGLTRLAQIHLAYKKLPFDPKLFSIEMDIISTAEEEERKASLLSALGIAGDLAALNEQMRIGMPPKRFAKLVYTDVLGLSGKFVELVEEAEVLPSLAEMDTAGPPDVGGPPTGPPADIGPPEEEMPGEGELEPPPEGAAEEGAPEMPGEGELEPPSPIGAEGERRRFRKDKSLRERAMVEDAKREVERPAREARLGVGIVEEAKRQAMESVTRAARHSSDVRAESPRFDSGGHEKPSRISRFRRSESLRKVLEHAVGIELEEKAREKKRRDDVVEKLSKKVGEVEVLVASVGKR